MTTSTPLSLPNEHLPFMPGDGGARKMGNLIVGDASWPRRAGRPARSSRSRARRRPSAPARPTARSTAAASSARRVQVRLRRGLRWVVIAGFPRCRPTDNSPESRRAAPSRRDAPGRAGDREPSAPIPPSWMPIELMLANPQSAKLAITNERSINVSLRAPRSL